MAVRHLQVDSPQLHHTSSLGKYIVRLYSDTDDFDTLRQHIQLTALPVVTYMYQRYTVVTVR